MDKETIIIGGVGLGILMLVMGGGGGKKRSGNDYAQTLYDASATRDMAAPGILAAAGSFVNQNKQIELAAANVHDLGLFDFISSLAMVDSKTHSDSLNFALGTTANYNETKLRKLGMQLSDKMDARHVASNEKTTLAGLASNERIQIREINANENVQIRGIDSNERISKSQIELERYAIKKKTQLMKKAMDNDFINGIIGGVTSGLNPAQSIYGGAGASGLNMNSAGMMGLSGGGLGGGFGGGGGYGGVLPSGTGISSILSSGKGAIDIQQLVSFASNLLGGSSGAGLSQAGGGVGQDKKGGGFDLGGLIKDIAPLALALL